MEVRRGDRFIGQSGDHVAIVPQCGFQFVETDRLTDRRVKALRERRCRGVGRRVEDVLAKE
jgi:hypothetical protein